MLTLSRSTTVQPIGAQSVATRLLAFKPASLIYGGMLLDIVRRSAMTFGVTGTGTVPTMPVRPGGLAYLGSRVDATNGGQLVTPFPLVAVNGDVTLVFYGGGFNTGINGATIALRSSASATPVIQLDNNNSDLRFIVRNDAASIITITGTGYASYSGPKVIIARRSGANMNLYVNGVSVASSGSGPTGALTVNTMTYLAANLSGTYQSFSPAYMLLGAVFGSALPDTEIAEISRLPWSAVRTPQRRLYFGAAAAPAGSILPAMLQQGLYAGYGMAA